ncbi:MAG: hypothetical protein Q3966_01240 [Neisseria sp.]|nr:hypothetical protein [Neisseria sp.]
MYKIQIAAALTGGLIGGLAYILLLRHRVRTAQKKYPPLKIKLPPSAVYSDTFAQWARQNRYGQTAPRTWRRGKGLLLGATEIRFIADDEIEVSEIIRAPWAEQAFPINAPVLFGRAFRAHKIKQLNKLLAYWRIEPVAPINPKGKKEEA